MVNVAARLEQLTRETGATILVSDNVVEKLNQESPNMFALKQVSIMFCVPVCM